MVGEVAAVLDTDVGPVEDVVLLLFDLVEGVDAVLDALVLTVVVRDREVVVDGVDERLLALVLDVLGEALRWACDRVEDVVLCEPEEAASAIATPAAIAASTAAAKSQKRGGGRLPAGGIWVVSVALGSAGGAFSSIWFGGAASAVRARPVGASGGLDATTVATSACVASRAASPRTGTSSAACCGRSSGGLASIRKIRVSRAAGTSGRSSPTACGSTLAC